VPLTAIQLQAAALAAAGLGARKIARQCKTSCRTVERWRHNPEFQAEVQRLRDEYNTAVRNRGIALIENNVGLADQIETRLVGVIKARAADEEIRGVPGGATGLLAVKRRTIVVDAEGNREEVSEYKLDRALLAEIRAQQEHALKMLGKWQEKVEVTHKQKQVFMGWDIDALASLSREDFETLQRISHHAQIEPPAIDVEAEVIEPGEPAIAAQPAEPVPSAAGGATGDREENRDGPVPDILPGHGRTPPRAVQEAPRVLPSWDRPPRAPVPGGQPDGKN
jgi:hypothetical protein